MESIPCIFCKQPNDRVLIEENGYKGRKCSRCGLIYISPRPSSDEIIDLYGHDHANISASAHIHSEFHRRLFARHNLRKIREFVMPCRLLELGAGAGFFLDEARKQGFDPYAIEFNPIQAQFIKEKLKIPCEKIPLNLGLFGGKKFDLVYHCDVISHFFDPFEEFRKINQILSEKSFLVFETGNLGEIDEKYLNYFSRFQYPDHLFFFSTENLKVLLEETGFELIKMHRFSIEPQLQIVRRLAGIQQFFSRGAKEPPTSASSAPNAEDHHEAKNNSGNRSTATRGARMIAFYINYILRYHIGALAPKKNRPQTVLLIARKIRSIED